MSFEIPSSTLRDSISQFLTPERIAEIATNNGYNSKANFTPGEYKSLLDKTAAIVLKNLKNGPFSHSQDNLYKERVVSIVDEILSKECKRVPRDLGFPDAAPALNALKNWLTSFFSQS